MERDSDEADEQDPLMAARLADEELAGEYFGCLMLVAAGLMISSSANDLVLLFLGLELISIPTYVLLFLGRRDKAVRAAHDALAINEAKGDRPRIAETQALLDQL